MWNQGAILAESELGWINPSCGISCMNQLVPILKYSCILQAQAKIMRKFHNYLGGALLRKPQAGDAAAHSPGNGATSPLARDQGHTGASSNDVVAAIEAVIEGAVQVHPLAGNEQTEQSLYRQADCLVCRHID